MAGHAQLKFVMTECLKTQIRLTRLILSVYIFVLFFCDQRQFNVKFLDFDRYCGNQLIRQCQKLRSNCKFTAILHLTLITDEMRS